MVLRGRSGQASYVISLKPHSLAVSRDDSRVVSWDLGGRLYSCYDAAATWRRGLDGRVIEKRGSGNGRIRRVLDEGDAAALVDRTARFAQEAREAIEQPTWRWTETVDPHESQVVASHLHLCSQFTARAAAEDAARFAATYSPIGILPPDQYLSLVVQATEGCAFNTCTFCDLYHEGYRVKTAQEFAAHVDAVRAYLGESASLRSRGIFLGAANALAVPMARLLPMFDILIEELDAIRKGVCAFVDAFAGGLKSVDDYRVLGDLGLRRVYVGLESGHDPLLSFVRKPGTAAQAIDTVRTIKAAGVQVGVIVMIGLGGERYAAGHVADTVRAVQAMGLGAGDLLYFSDLVEVPGTRYPALARDADLESLDAAQRRLQRQAIRVGLVLDPAGPQCSTYDTREFVY